MRPSFHRPNPYRRAIAQAIELERTHDALSRIVGHSIPLPDRIVPEGQRKGQPRRQKMNLGRPMTLEGMNDVADVRLGALADLVDEIGVHHKHDQSSDVQRIGMTEGFSDFLDDDTANGTNLLADMVEEARERTSSEQGFRPEFRNGPCRLVNTEDRLSSIELQRRDIARAADAPPPLIVAKPAPEAPVPDTRSIAIDLMTEGLLDFYRIDRAALHGELVAVRNAADQKSKVRPSVALASPAERSNKARTIRSLGTAFPAALFTLRGLALEVVRMTLPIDPKGGELAWIYNGGSGSTGEKTLPNLTRNDAMPNYDVFDFPNRALRDVTGDRRFHDAIVIHTIDRFGITGAQPTTTMRLRRGSAHLDPPGLEGRRFIIQRASDVRAPTQTRAYEHRDLAHASMIVNGLAERGHKQRCTVRLREGLGLIVLIANPGSERFSHIFPIERDTIDDGQDAINARLDQISHFLKGWQTGKYHRRTSMGTGHGGSFAAKTATTLDAQTSTQSSNVPVNPANTAQSTANENTNQIVDGEQTGEDALGQNPETSTLSEANAEAAAVVVPLTPRDAIALFGDEVLERWDTSERVDALLLDLLDEGLDADAVHLHQQEKMTLAHRVLLSDGLNYQLERYERTMGRVTHAIGIVTVNRVLPPGTVEALRDGSIARMVPKHKRFGRAQVRKVALHEGATLITVRVPLEDRPA